jgi:7,8-dihydropterin-6-yl-methyl-4-(beta-D-ribofuranosyl)aminobenzene 5'-phosphate synthase
VGNLPNGTRAKSPVLDEQLLQQMGAKIHKNTAVTHLPSKESPLLTITGEIPRETSFEKGFPYQHIEDPSNEMNLIPDPLIKDDQALVVNISDKGLVILTGCGHAGVINTINYAKK